MLSIHSAGPIAPNEAFAHMSANILTLDHSSVVAMRPATGQITAGVGLEDLFMRVSPADLIRMAEAEVHDVAAHHELPSDLPVCVRCGRDPTWRSAWCTAVMIIPRVSEGKLWRGESGESVRLVS